MKHTFPSKFAPLPHMPALDGLRGLAILVVMLHHFLPPNYPLGIPGGLGGFFIKTLYRLCDVGWWGVDLFFVLSGFLITGILLSAKNSAHFFRNFYMRRVLRIFPLYYGVLVFLFIILPFLANESSISGWVNNVFSDYVGLGKKISPMQAWLWLYGVNIKTALVANGWIFSRLTHFWSLAVEEHFYIVWPAVIYFSQPKFLLKICLGVALGSIIFRAAFVIGGLAPAYVYVLTPCRLDGLALGSLMAVLYHSTYRDAMIAFCKRALCYLIPVSVACLLTFHRFSPIMFIFGHALLACLFAVVMPVAAAVSTETQSKSTGWLCSSTLRFFGKYSYGIYVLHPLVFFNVENILASPFFAPLVKGHYFVLMLLRATLGITFAVAVAYASWHLFEKHFLKMKRYFPNVQFSVKQRAEVEIPA